MYIEGPPSMYNSYASPEQTRHDRYRETLEAAGDKGQRIKKVTKVNESKRCMERGLQEEPFEYGVLMPGAGYTTYIMYMNILIFFNFYYYFFYL